MTIEQIRDNLQAGGQLWRLAGDHRFFYKLSGNDLLNRVNELGGWNPSTCPIEKLTRYELHAADHKVIKTSLEHASPEAEPVSWLPKEDITFNPSNTESIDRLMMTYGPEALFEIAEKLKAVAEADYCEESSS